MPDWREGAATAAEPAAAAAPAAVHNTAAVREGYYLDLDFKLYDSPSDGGLALFGQRSLKKTFTADEFAKLRETLRAYTALMETATDLSLEELIKARFLPVSSLEVEMLESVPKEDLTTFFRDEQLDFLRVQIEATQRFEPKGENEWLNKTSALSDLRERLLFSGHHYIPEAYDRAAELFSKLFLKKELETDFPAMVRTFATASATYQISQRVVHDNLGLIEKSFKSGLEIPHGSLEEQQRRLAMLYDFNFLMLNTTHYVTGRSTLQERSEMLDWFATKIQAPVFEQAIPGFLLLHEAEQRDKRLSQPDPLAGWGRMVNGRIRAHPESLPVYLENVEKALAADGMSEQRKLGLYSSLLFLPIEDKDLSHLERFFSGQIARENSPYVLREGLAPALGALLLHDYIFRVYYMDYVRGASQARFDRYIKATIAGMERIGDRQNPPSLDETVPSIQQFLFRIYEHIHHGAYADQFGAEMRGEGPLRTSRQRALVVVEGALAAINRVATNAGATHRQFFNSDSEFIHMGQDRSYWLVGESPVSPWYSRKVTDPDAQLEKLATAMQNIQDAHVRAVTELVRSEDMEWTDAALAEVAVGYMQAVPKVGNTENFEAFGEYLCSIAEGEGQGPYVNLYRNLREFAYSAKYQRSPEAGLADEELDRRCREFAENGRRIMILKMIDGLWAPHPSMRPIESDRKASEAHMPDKVKDSLKLFKVFHYDKELGVSLISVKPEEFREKCAKYFEAAQSTNRALYKQIINQRPSTGRSRAASAN